ncbi:MAG TPA: cysteine--tRNA ligase [Thermoanaerobaculia bacterium]|nr:cysteine--tRNA ligase [Thermoanaerobaculia bacterium]
MSQLKLFNTLSRSQEVFEPQTPGHVRMYSCGPTVYGVAHIGNLRTFLWSDLLRRYLRWKGLEVTQVMNLTDVDDKIIRNAIAAGKDLDSFTAPYIEAFHENLGQLRIRPADHYPRATEYIPQMVALVERLTARGHTYVSEGSTYFKISSHQDYGKLSRVEVASSSGFSRIESDEYEKDNARDFVLWKAKKEGEPSWSTALGEGRPGWHLECSAMSMDLLGESFDIHTGAVDLIFPHHENEISQSECATGKPFVSYWVHGEHLNIEQQKMSKSLGNIHTLAELIDQGYSTLSVRYALLCVPHRTRLSFSMKSLDDANQALERLALFEMRLSDIAKNSGSSPAQVSDRAAVISNTLVGEFETAMDDDLNTAGALGALFSFVREGNIAIDQNIVSATDAVEMLGALRKVDQVLDILPIAGQSVDSEIESMIEARKEARRTKQFAESDRLRDELLARGIILEDTPAGTRWRRK